MPWALPSAVRISDRHVDEFTVFPRKHSQGRKTGCHPGWEASVLALGAVEEAAG